MCLCVSLCVSLSLSLPPSGMSVSPCMYTCHRAKEEVRGQPRVSVLAFQPSCYSVVHGCMDEHLDDKLPSGHRKAGIRAVASDCMLVLETLAQAFLLAQ